MSDAEPTRRRVPLPQATTWPRVGKIRLGEQVPVMKDGKQRTTRSGEAMFRASALDYFRVDPEDEVTAPESAASFLEVYGDRPTRLRCQLPGRTISDVWEGAYRLYGTRKLKRICDGQTCDVRTATGGWASEPCVCTARMLPKDSNDRCKLGWTLTVLLPEVRGIGVWQITTGSEISVDRISGWLQLMEKVTGGDLAMIEFFLELVPVDVTPDGRTKTVYVLNAQAVGASPEQLTSGQAGRAVAALPSGIDLPSTPAPAVDSDDAVAGDVVDEGSDDPAPRPRISAPTAGSAEEALFKDRMEEALSFVSQDELVRILGGIVRRAPDAYDLIDDEVWEETYTACAAHRGPIAGQTEMVPAGHKDPQA